ncbi:MAG: peptidoglycan bridge formation glycyltransferase FemA/FemB family protein [Solobacterium sp.]|nr:peptidoglycan bridge formation glycyltransferase FemA/FemB family protein [Solobacterium sp.]MBQ1356458.1 peptidoglycan bridge formation glycyltransferase FemA/FemB family protein [Solobacterium sp.]
MELRRIEEKELNDFVMGSLNVHYMKTGMWARFKEKTDHDRHEFFGFYEEDRLVGTAMVLQNSWLGHRYLYVPWGVCMDYGDAEQVRKAYRLLQKHADEKKVAFLRVDPNVVRCHRTITGEPVDDGFSSEIITETLKELGYTHKGYGYAYNGSWTNRYTLIADLSADLDTIYARYAKARRTALNRHAVIGVSTRLGDARDIGTLMALEKQLTEQDGFAPHSRQFFQGLLDCFGEHAVMYVTEIRLDDMISGISDELAGKKYRKDPEARAAKEKELARAEELKQAYGSIVPVACGLFIRCGDYSWDLYTYNHKEFNFIKPVDSLHAFAMADMKAHGVLHYDMCGFSGTASKEDPYYGLYAYKRSFGPEFIEQIGEFDYVRREREMKRFRFEKLAVNHVKRRYWAKRYKKKQK